MLYSCEIENFKGIPHKVITFNRFSILAGQNNAGKSTILHAILLAQELIKLAIQRTKGKIIQNTSISIEEIYLIPLANVESIWNNNRFTQTNPVSIKLYINPESYIEVRLTKGKNGNIAVKIFGDGKNQELIKQISKDETFCILVPGLAGIPSKELYKGAYARKKSITVGDSNLVLRNVVNSLGRNEKKKDDFIQLQNLLRQLFPDFKELVTSYDENKDEFIKVNFKKIYSSQEYDIVNAGNGFLQLLQILSYIFEYRPKVLLLDEPDSHLHPSNQIALMDVLRQLSQSLNFQIIASTHSKDILKSSPPTSLIWINTEKENKPGVEKGSIVQAYIDLGGLDELDQLRIKPDLSHIFVEDKDSFFWKHLFKEAFGHKWMEYVLLSSFKGKSNKTALFLVSEFHQNHFSSSKIAGVIDRDFDSDERLAEYISESNKNKIKPFVLPVHEIENYLLEPKLVLHALKQLKIPSITSSTIEELLQEAINNTLSEQKYKLMDTLELENKKLTASSVEKTAIEIINHKKNQDFQSYLMWLRGKPILKNLRDLVKSKYNLTLSDSILCKARFEIGLPSELNELLTWIKQ